MERPLAFAANRDRYNWLYGSEFRTCGPGFDATFYNAVPQFFWSGKTLDTLRFWDNSWWMNGKYPRRPQEHPTEHIRRVEIETAFLATQGFTLPASTIGPGFSTQIEDMTGFFRDPEASGVGGGEIGIFDPRQPCARRHESSGWYLSYIKFHPQGCMDEVGRFARWVREQPTCYVQHPDGYDVGVELAELDPSYANVQTRKVVEMYYKPLDYTDMGDLEGVAPADVDGFVIARVYDEMIGLDVREGADPTVDPKDANNFFRLDYVVEAISAYIWASLPRDEEMQTQLEHLRRVDEEKRAILTPFYLSRFVPAPVQ